jgi:hypothetical protein
MALARVFYRRPNHEEFGPMPIWDASLDVRIAAAQQRLAAMLADTLPHRRRPQDPPPPSPGERGPDPARPVARAA